MDTRPRMLQGVYPFEGRGLNRPALLHAELRYAVPPGRQAQLVYFRAGNSAGEMIDLIVMRDGAPMRHFPLGARGDCHVSLAVIEDLEPDTRVEIHLAAPEGITGTVVVDVGLLEMPREPALAL